MLENLHAQIAQCKNPFYQPMVDMPLRYRLRLGCSTIFRLEGKYSRETALLTPSKYFSWPKRSRYLLQKGRVPKFLLMTLRSLLADAMRRGTLGASGRFA